MSTPPRFVPALPPTVTQGKTTALDRENAPTCDCGAPGPLDASTAKCVACWRIEAMFLRYMIDSANERPPDAGIDFADEPPSGIVGRHWITPNPAAVARPRDAVTSAEPPPPQPVCPCPNPGDQVDCGGMMMCDCDCHLPLTDPRNPLCVVNLGVAREAREVPRLTATSGPGVGVDVVLTPPDPLKVVCPTCRQNPGWSCVNLGDRMQRHGFHASRRRAVMP